MGWKSELLVPMVAKLDRQRRGTCRFVWNSDPHLYHVLILRWRFLLCRGGSWKGTFSKICRRGWRQFRRKFGPALFERRPRWCRRELCIYHGRALDEIWLEISVCLTVIGVVGTNDKHIWAPCQLGSSTGPQCSLLAVKWLAASKG